MSDLDFQQSGTPRGRAYACVVSAVSLLRGIGIIVKARPKTLLRVMCAVTFDTIYKLRTSRRLPFQRIKTLLMLLEFGDYMNRFFDRKGFDRQTYRRLRQQLKQAGVNQLVVDYAKQLKIIEQGRPSPGGAESCHEAVRAYREDVVRLSLALVTASVFDTQTLGQGLEVFRCNDDFELIFRIVMQCQVIDDVLDYNKDNAAGLPSFLTASTSRHASAVFTRQTIAAYRKTQGLAPSMSAFPFRIALGLVSVCASGVLMLSGCSGIAGSADA